MRYIYENYMKHLKILSINLFKEIAPGFNHILLTIWKISANLSLFKLVNTAVIFVFSSSLMLHVVLWVSYSTVPYTL